MRQIVFLLFFGIGLFFTGCKYDPGPSDPTTIQQLFPLANGNYWLYDQTTYNFDGTINDQGSGTIEVLGRQTIHGHQGYLSDFGGGGGILYFSGNDLLTAQSDTSAPQTLLHYPMSSGQTIAFRDTQYTIRFDTSFSETVIEKQLLTFQGRGEQVTVPAGTFSCYHFVSTGINGEILKDGFGGRVDTSMTHLYFSPGVGLIKEMAYGNDSGQVKLFLKMELKSYLLK